MKNALILHGTSNNSQGNWFPWLKEEQEKKGWKVWVPDLPNSDLPNIKTYKNYIFSNKDWKFNKESYLIGHSSGAVAILGILQNLSDDVIVDTCILVGSFIEHKDDPDWDYLKGLFLEPLNLDKIKHRAKHFIFIHSNNDPYCPLDDAKFLAEKLNGELIIKHGQGHFNLEVGEQYKQFPLILEFCIQTDLTN